MTDEMESSRALLVEMLGEAAQLEHCLLDTYLYAACALKSLPEEFAMLEGRPNRRRAIQFERARSWKQAVLGVAHEEMLHLHYVQCMLRGLGAEPSFALPKRTKQGTWIIPNWRAQLGSVPVDGDKGVQIPVTRPDLGAFERFVIYESTDSLQYINPLGPEATALYQKLYSFELDLRFESMLVHVADDAKRTEFKEKLLALYDRLSPFAAEDKLTMKVAVEAIRAVELPPLEELRFQSISDFYLRGIQPLYQQAFDRGWVQHTDRALDNELQDPNYAAEGFLPIGPVPRSKNFTQFSKANTGDPLRNFKRIEDVIREIVEEGEGASLFVARAERMLAEIGEMGTRNFVLALMKDQRSSRDPGYKTPEWLASAQLLRWSHLYRFAMIVTEIRHEQELCREDGAHFEPFRAPAVLEGQPALEAAAKELPKYFNAAYLVMLAWLSRMYEVQDWMADKPRRQAIEMLASWPLMSMAIRPMLELASCLPVNLQQLFRVERDALPDLPLHAQQLLALYKRSERSEKICADIDYYALRALSDVAAWAAEQAAVFAAAELPEPNKQMIVTRLRGLATLHEFQKQFPFREHGGYSSRMPDLGYQQSHPDSDRYEEDPSTPSPWLQNTLALALRFTGFGLVQLATDPDPPTDEVGCSGTHMFHAADGGHYFDRALVWQNADPSENIVREPRKGLPALGINCVDVSLVAANSASAGYVPLQVMQSLGAVQANGVQQALQVQGLAPVLHLPVGEILGGDRALRINLLAKGAVRPFSNGQNHLVYQDGEPLDPFILNVSADTAAGPQSLFQREVWNDGVSMLDMMPLERTESARGPCGFDFNFDNIPSWAKAGVSPDQQPLLAGTMGPRGYLAKRCELLVGEIGKAIDGVNSQSQVDAVVSLAERLMLVAQPRGTTVAWLGVLLHYGHTISGEQQVANAANPIFDALAKRCGLNLTVASPTDSRDEPNARWLADYTLGVMDTDALSCLVYGTLYVPLVVQKAAPVVLTQRWVFPRSVESSVADYGARFDRPFWAKFSVEGNVRTTELPDGKIITETLTDTESKGYSYTATGTGLPGVTQYTGSFWVEAGQDASECALIWNVCFTPSDETSAVATTILVASAAQAMAAALTKYYGPRH